MSNSIVIKMKDGTVKNFPRKSRPGGSYSKHVSYEGVFVIITDEWGVQTAIPASDVEEVVVTPLNHW